MEYKVNEIVVCNPDQGRNNASAFLPGKMYRVEREDGDILRVDWNGKTGYGVYASSVRLATEIEIGYFNTGIKNISDIPKDIVVNNYLLY